MMELDRYKGVCEKEWYTTEFLTQLFFEFSSVYIDDPMHYFVSLKLLFWLYGEKNVLLLFLISLSANQIISLR